MFYVRRRSNSVINSTLLFRLSGAKYKESSVYMLINEPAAYGQFSMACLFTQLTQMQLAYSTCENRAGNSDTHRNFIRKAAKTSESAIPNGPLPNSEADNFYYVGEDIFGCSLHLGRGSIAKSNPEISLYRVKGGNNFNSLYRLCTEDPFCVHSTEVFDTEYDITELFSSAVCRTADGKLCYFDFVAGTVIRTPATKQGLLCIEDTEVISDMTHIFAMEMRSNTLKDYSFEYHLAPFTLFELLDILSLWDKVYIKA